MIWLKSGGKDKIEGDATTHPISGNYSTITIVNVSDPVNTTLASNANISSVSVDVNATEFSTTTTPANATATQEFSTPTSEEKIVNGNGSKALIVILFVLSIILFILVIAVVSNYLYHECH